MHVKNSQDKKYQMLIAGHFFLHNTHLHCRRFGEDVCLGAFALGSAQTVPVLRDVPLAPAHKDVPGRQEVAALHSPAMGSPAHPCVVCLLDRS